MHVIESAYFFDLNVFKNVYSKCCPVTSVNAILKSGQADR